MIVIERTVDISKPVQTETLRGNEFKLEANAHTFRISLVNNGVAVPMTGSVSASMLLADGSGLTLGGSLDNGVAVLTLPQAAYGVPGRFMLAIYSVQTGATEAETVKTCIYACVGAVINTYGNQQYDPGNLIPDAETLAAYIEACQTATTAANTAAGRAETAALTAVTYAEQTGKTEAEKSQARTNIGAVGETAIAALEEADALIRNRLDAANGLVNYGYDTPFNGSFGSFSLTRNGTHLTMSGTIAARSNAIFVVKLNGTPVSASSASAVQQFADPIALTPGHKYRLHGRRLSGTYVGVGFYVRAVYAGGSTDIGEFYQLGDDFFDDFAYAPAEGVAGVQICIGTARASTDATFTDYVCEVTLQDITANALPPAPGSNGTYILKVTVTDGVPAYAWVSESAGLMSTPLMSAAPDPTDESEE